MSYCMERILELLSRWKSAHIGCFVPSWLLRFYATLTTRGVVHLRAELMNESGATMCIACQWLWCSSWLQLAVCYSCSKWSGLLWKKEQIEKLLQEWTEVPPYLFKCWLRQELFTLRCATNPLPLPPPHPTSCSPTPKCHNRHPVSMQLRPAHRTHTDCKMKVSIKIWFRD